jgi:hypothetical protein
MNDAQKKSYEMAAEVSKQLITLASAMVTFAVAFSKGFHSVGSMSGFIAGAYVALFVSILLGVRVLYVLTSSLGGIQSDDLAQCRL